MDSTVSPVKKEHWPSQNSPKNHVRRSPISPSHSKQPQHSQHSPKSRHKKTDSTAADNTKRRCVSTACIACRKRKSKCDGNTPACAACSSVYGTECVYDPNSDHRRKGVYKQDIDNLKTRNSTLQTLIQAILNYPEEDVPELIRQIRTCESLDNVAEQIVETGLDIDDPRALSGGETAFPTQASDGDPSFESQLANKFGELRLDHGLKRYIGGTSNLLYYDGPNGVDDSDSTSAGSAVDPYEQQESAISSWTTVTSDPALITHLLNMYFTWHYSFFTTLPKGLFYRDFLQGRPRRGLTSKRTKYCTALLVNAMLSLGCHYTSVPAAREDPNDSATAGDHFFKEAKRLFMEDEEYENPNIAAVQAMALMSVREAGCGREGKGWAYSGISFRMACDLGLNLDSSGLAHKKSGPDPFEEDARRVTFWGCYLFDKCWSNYLGRLPQFQPSLNVTVPKIEVFPDEDASEWAPYTDAGFNEVHAQPARTRAVALQISALCDISSDLMRYFYHPQIMSRPPTKQVEVKRLSEIHGRLESWRRDLQKEFEPREGALSGVLHMHMLFQILYIHLFRRFLNYDPTTSPLPANVSPRKYCTTAAATISKLLRLYKRSYGLRQICNIVVYIAHSACTIHLLNLPEKTAKRDITHGVKQLEEIAEGWICARRTLCVLSVQARRWNVPLPEEAAIVLARTDAKFGRARKHSTNSTQTTLQQTEVDVVPHTDPVPQEGWSQPLEFSQFNTSDVDFNSFGVGDDTSAFSGASQTMSHVHDPMASVTTPMSRTNTNFSASSNFTPYFSNPQQIDEFIRSQAQQSSSTTSTASFNSPSSSHSRPMQPSQMFPSSTTSGQSFPLPAQTPSTSQFYPSLPNPSTNMAAPPLNRPTSFQRPNLPQHTQPQPSRPQNTPSLPPQGIPPMPTQSQDTTFEPQMPAQPKPSPSDRMFGGVEALLQDSEEFWVNDQQEVAHGFGRWELGGSGSGPG